MKENRGIISKKWNLNSFDFNYDIIYYLIKSIDDSENWLSFICIHTVVLELSL